MPPRPRSAACVPASMLGLLLLASGVAGCTSSGGAGGTPTAPAGSASQTSGPALPSFVPVSVSPSSVSTSPAPALAQLGHRFGYTLPDRKYTPGSALAASTTQVCSRTWNAAHKTISFQVQNAVSARYDVLAGPKTNVHLDQLIPASLGGDATVGNVWPQVSTTPSRDGWKVKNELEIHMHQLVCTGRLGLATAQHALATDWLAARKYLAITVPGQAPPTTSTSSGT